MQLILLPPLIVYSSTVCFIHCPVLTTYALNIHIIIAKCQKNQDGIEPLPEVKVKTKSYFSELELKVGKFTVISTKTYLKILENVP